MPSSYPAPRKNVLLLSCMDLRLLDDIVRYMHRDNLTNRYDQFILAGRRGEVSLLDYLPAPSKKEDN